MTITYGNIFVKRYTNGKMNRNFVAPKPQIILALTFLSFRHSVGNISGLFLFTDNCVSLR